MAQPLRLGIAGLGTVGVGVVRIIRQHAALLEARTGRPITISAVSARSRDKDRGVSIAGYDWEDDPVALATRDDVDVFVELMGGDAGPAKDAVEAALAAGKDVVTANKAMLALHGQALAETAEAAGRVIRYEAAVAGGIPVIKALTEGLAGNEVTRVMGVMNGSCNYILTRMEDAGLPYADVFAEADGLGYLEADPHLDVGGIDAAHKLAILSSLAFGSRVDFDGIELEGIERVSIDDIRAAADMGYKIKLLGVAQMTGRGLEQRMQPCLVPDDIPLGPAVRRHQHGRTGRRRGRANRSARPRCRRRPHRQCGDGRCLRHCARLRRSVFGQPAASLSTPTPAMSQAPAAYYLRMALLDKPGALAKIATVLGEAGVSIDRMRQYRTPRRSAPVLIVTHKTTRAALDEALGAMSATGVLAGEPVALRIEDL